MKPSWPHFLFAYGSAICTHGTGVLTAVLIGLQIVSLLRGVKLDGSFALPIFAALAAAYPLGWILGGICIRPFVHIFGRMVNGAPFQSGDRVCILVGPHRYRIVRVYAVWRERHQVRVELGEKEKKDVTDVFIDDEVCRQEL